MKSKEFLIRQGERAYKATEDLVGQPRIFEVFDAVKHRVLEVDIENPLKTESRGIQQEPFDPDDMREIFLQ